MALQKVQDLRYGENPHQASAWYAEEPRTALGDAAVLQGKELSYTNLLDLDAAARIVLEFDEPAAAVIKHTNPCGAATGTSAADAYVRAREADPLSAFGGIVALNRPLDAEVAAALVVDQARRGDRAVGDREARAILAKKASMRVVTADFSRLRADAGRELRSILGAVLVQARDRVVEAAAPWPSRRSAGGDEAAADRGGVDGAALRVARLRAREVQHRHLHRRGPHAGDRRRSDEPRRLRERGAHEGRGARRRTSCAVRWPPRTRSSRSATASTRLRRRAPPRWCRPAGR